MENMNSSNTSRMREAIRESFIYKRLQGPIFNLKGYMFDLYHGVKTMPQVTLDELEIDSPNKKGGGIYAGTEPKYFRAVMDSLDIDFSRFHFIDFGSGMGRALLLAADYPFKKITGIEFSPELHEIAEKNIRSYTRRKRACSDLESVCEDATTYALPREPSVYYLFNPFNRELFGSVIHSFERSLAEDPRDAYVIYMNPVNDDLFVDSPAFEPLDRGPWHSVHVARRGE
ncbi:MAG TPA: class I SAM-dependent methyltransferase [Blastocatellia bacterium]|nr:class I SAM-dependent methyltransferase [Blastocatellia bacterium]